MKKLVCVVCPMGCHMEVDIENDYKVTGNQCLRGVGYAKEELTAPKRIVTTTVKIKNGLYNRIPVKTSRGIPKNLVYECMKEINKLEIESPIKVGEILIKNVLETGADIVATRNM